MTTEAVATSAQPAETHDPGHGAHHHHVASAQTFLGTLMGLLFLTVITVIVSRFHFGSANMLIAMAIAALKASLVITFFMHLKWDTAINQIVFLGSFLFLALLLLFTLADLSTRGRANPIQKQPAPVDLEWVHPSKRGE